MLIIILSIEHHDHTHISLKIIILLLLLSMIMIISTKSSVSLHHHSSFSEILLACIPFLELVIPALTHLFLLMLLNTLHMIVIRISRSTLNKKASY